MTRSSFQHSRGCEKVGRELLRWFKQSGRKLPWRETKDPYRIWVSEVMLQQTQVSRVIDYYERFLKRLPTVEALSRVRWSTMLMLWRGLGYYSRARNLIAGAKVICSEHGGKLPKNTIALRQIPGIGEYTANAIQAFAWNRSVPALDTNLKRVIGRLFLASDKKIEMYAQRIFDALPKSAADLNHGFMDIGATICLPHAPRCAECPLRALCRSRDKFPVTQDYSKQLKTRSKRTRYAVLCLHHNDCYLMVRAKGEKYFKLPRVECSSLSKMRAELKKFAHAEFGIEISVRPARPPIVETSERGEIELYPCRAQILRGVPTRKGEWIWPKESHEKRIFPPDWAVFRILPRGK